MNAMYLLIHVHLLLVWVTLIHQTILTYISFVAVFLSLTFFALVFTILNMLEELGWIVMFAVACLRNHLLLLLLMIVVLLHIGVLLLTIFLFLFVI